MSHCFQGKYDEARSEYKTIDISINELDKDKLQYYSHTIYS